MLTLLSLNITIIGHDEGMICFAGLLLRIAMYICKVYTTRAQPVFELIMGSQRYPQHWGLLLLLHVLQTTVVAVRIFANQPLMEKKTSCKDRGPRVGRFMEWGWRELED